MYLRKPIFYDQFKCTASKCSDTCCVGWEIDVDKVSQKKYRKAAGPFGDKLRENIVDGHFKLLPHDRCPFLDSENLCEIYKHLGEKALCDICREHPRFVEVYGDIMERGLGLCCEEAARLLLESKGPLEFTLETTNDPEDEIGPDDIEIRDQVLSARKMIFDELANKEKPLEKRLYNAFGYTSENPFAPLKDASAYQELLSRTESFGPAWENALARIKKRIENSSMGNREAEQEVFDEGFFSEDESIRILAYLIFRHYAKCLFDGREQGKLQFALFFWNTLRFFTKELAGDAPNIYGVNAKDSIKINAIKILSRQLEYSEENMELIEEELEK